MTTKHRTKHYIPPQAPAKTPPQAPAKAPTPQGLAQVHTHNLDALAQRLAEHRMWHILPAGTTDVTKTSGLWDTQTGLLYPQAGLAALDSFLKQHPFVYLESAQDATRLATLHSATGLLWRNAESGSWLHLKEAQSTVQRGRWAGQSGWQLPTKDMLYQFATAPGNPHRAGRKYRLNFTNGETYAWLTNAGGCNVDEGYWGITPEGMGYIFACHTFWHNASLADRLARLAQLSNQGWHLRSAANGSIFSAPAPDQRWQGLSMQARLDAWGQEDLSLCAQGAPQTVLPVRAYMVAHQLALLDYTPCRLPKMDAAQRTDPEKGLWELWGQAPATLKTTHTVARDPGRDVQHRAVAIDFGTSSTVVAMNTAHGARELLRIGVRDFYEPTKAQHFENPTVLECLDFQQFTAPWNHTAYRPALNWDWMRAAHEAQANFRNNPGDTQVLASILPKLKQWALRASEHRRVRLTDRQGYEFELPAHTERNPVRGQALVVSANDPFDPIELYAWYLGMAINWRGRGLFLKYYLSFPVKYPREVKERILASFRRGLQRSLPRTLIEHHPHVLNDFEVNDLASEPAAYAAAALPHLKVEPTDTGVPYAVFDFGGGTTDFDFGLLRWATPDEEAQGYERVFEHLASSGDNFLGGENLLEHLVYASFQHNLGILREKRIQFTQPLDAKPFAGSEAFLANTQAAQTNTILLAGKLRPFLENSEAKLDSSQIKLDLMDANGTKQTCDLNLDTKALDALLAQRMRDGVAAFLAELARLRPQLPADTPIHVLLAGNGSRSRHIQALFNTEGDKWKELLTQAFAPHSADPGGTTPEIVVHAPLPQDEANPHAPTTKTGVALGLLRLAPGENTLLVNHTLNRHDGQAPFTWFVGRMRRGRFEAVLLPDSTYGTWEELGPLQQGVFNLFATTSPRARNGLAEGDTELKKYRQDFPAAPVGARLFARASAPNTIELAAALEVSALDASTAKILQLR